MSRNISYSSAKFDFSISCGFGFMLQIVIKTLDILVECHTLEV